MPYGSNSANRTRQRTDFIDHAWFEWRRQEFQQWAERVARRFGYRFEVTDLGLADPVHGAPSQMAVFER